MADVKYESNLLSRQDQFVTEKFEQTRTFLVLRSRIRKLVVAGVREFFMLIWYVMLTRIFFHSLL